MQPVVRLLRPAKPMLSIVDERRRAALAIERDVVARKLVALGRPVFFTEVVIGGRGGIVPYVRRESGMSPPAGRYACFATAPLPAGYRRPVEISLELATTLFDHAGAAMFDGTIAAELVLELNDAIKKATDEPIR